MGKLVPVLIIAFLVWLVFFPRSIPALARTVGRRLGLVRRMGKEIVDNEDHPDSPLARAETLVGRNLTQRVLAKHSFSRDMRLQERVLHVGRQLAARSRRQGIAYRFLALDDPQPFALAVPGGSIFVSTGLVELCGGDDSRLAGVLGHEVAHIENRHAIKSYATRTATQAGVRFLTLGRGLLVGRMAGVVENLVYQGYNEEQELEADLVGSKLASAAGYDPLAVARLYEEIDRPPASEIVFFKNHPPLRQRARAIQARWAR